MSPVALTYESPSRCPLDSRTLCLGKHFVASATVGSEPESTIVHSRPRTPFGGFVDLLGLQIQLSRSSRSFFVDTLSVLIGFGSFFVRSGVGSGAVGGEAAGCWVVVGEVAVGGQRLHREQSSSWEAVVRRRSW